MPYSKVTPEMLEEAASIVETCSLKSGDMVRAVSTDLRDQAKVLRCKQAEQQLRVEISQIIYISGWRPEGPSTADKTVSALLETFNIERKKPR